MAGSGQRSIVIFRIGSIGDTVVALPCLHAIERRFPDCRRILLTNRADSVRASSAELVLDGSGLVDSAEHFPPRLGSFSAGFSLIRRLRATGARSLVYLAPRTSIGQVRRDVMFFRMAGIREVIGAPTSEYALQRQLTADGAIEPEASYLARTLSIAMPVDLSAPNWDLRLLASERAAASDRLAPLPDGLRKVAFCPGAKWASKDWGESRWAELVRRLREHAPDVVPVMLGAADERDLSQRILASWNGPALNLCGNLSPRESAAMLQRCELLVCHDSGPMHLAATQGTPCVALFGNLNKPRQWFPWGEQHLVVHDPRGVASISVDEVIAAVTHQLAHAPARHGAMVNTRHLRVVR